MLPGPLLDGLQACRCFTFFVLNKGEQFTIELKRRSIQSQANNLVFSTRRIPAAFRPKFHCLSTTAHVIHRRMMCAMRKAGVFSILFVVVLLAVAIVAEAQQPAKIPRIGYVSGSGNPKIPGPLVEGFRQGLRDLGYIEGKNILVEYRYTVEAELDRIPELATELVQLKVDVLVATFTSAIRAAKQATKTIPIVMMSPTDPVAAGLVDSLARPGGNITGVVRPYPRVERQAAGATQGGGAEDIPRRSPLGRECGCRGRLLLLKSMKAVRHAALKLEFQSL